MDHPSQLLERRALRWRKTRQERFDLWRWR
jgi:hypothetical protein